MEGDEQVALLLLGDLGAALEGDEFVLRAGQEDGQAQSLFNAGGNFFCQLQDNVFFFQAISFGPAVLAAVAGARERRERVVADETPSQMCSARWLRQ